MTASLRDHIARSCATVVVVRLARAYAGAVSTPPVVRLDVWGVSGMQIPRSFLRMGSQRRAVRSLPGLQFAKLMGTGSGETFTMRDADPTHWALLTTWVDEDHARAFEESRVFDTWNSASDERLGITMRPLVTRGKWSGRDPFAVPDTKADPGPIAAITRARIRPEMTGTCTRENRAGISSPCRPPTPASAH